MAELKTASYGSRLWPGYIPTEISINTINTETGEVTETQTDEVDSWIDAYLIFLERHASYISDELLTWSPPALSGKRLFHRRAIIGFQRLSDGMYVNVDLSRDEVVACIDGLVDRLKLHQACYKIFLRHHLTPKPREESIYRFKGLNDADLD